MRRSKRNGKEPDIIDLDTGNDLNSRKGARRGRRHARNVEFAVVTYAFLFLFIGLCAYFVYFVSFKSEDFINHASNARLSKLSDTVRRGNITTKDGVILAKSRQKGKTEIRIYPKGNMYAHVVGYNSNGMAGVEQESNFQLLRSHSFFLTRIANDLANKKSQGDTVVTTLDSKLQEVAYNGIGSYKGAAVAIDPATGAVLAMVSKPDFDPNTVASSWKSLSSSENGSSVLLNRATQGLYPPGSTFKIVTSLSYLENGGKTSDIFQCNGGLTNQGYTMHCYGGEVHGRQDLFQAFGNSCNIAYATAGLSLEKGELMDTAQRLLFNKDLPTTLSNVKKSRFTMEEVDHKPLVMQTSIGQGNTLVTPLHMAMIASAIANDGKMVQTHDIDHIENDNGSLVKSFDHKNETTIMKKEEAKILRRLMRYVVTNGTGRKLSGASYKAYGKTGTAEYSSNKRESHSWFVGFAKKGKKKIAVAVVMEGAGAGSAYALPLAGRIFDTYLGE
jgi:peptidoglycan glycosyltransferase